MKLLHVIASVNPQLGGPVEGILRSAEALAELGHSREIVCVDPADALWLKDYPIKVYPLGLGGPLYRKLQQWLPWLRYGYTPHLVPWLRDNASRYDIVVVNGLWNYCALASRRAFVGHSTPYVVFTHGMLDPWFRKTYPLKSVAKQFVWWFSEGPLLRHAKAVLFTTEEEMTLAHNAFWPYRCVQKVVGYGTHLPDVPEATQREAFATTFPDLAHKRFLLFMSRIHQKKGCDLLIDAFAQVAAAEPDVDLVIAGPDQVGLMAKLKARAFQLGVADRIHWPGMLSGDVKWGAFRTCEAFILPSHQENFGIVVAEAMACSRPVLITNKVNIWREIATSGGGLVEPDTTEGILSLLRRYFAMAPRKRVEMGFNAQQEFVKSFDTRSAARSLLETINTVRPR